ncbi:MAG TPA: hypothetical protein PKA19_09455, partial [Bacillota bacterium]|nr:hypothetical protein [Bacillota bacterium]
KRKSSSWHLHLLLCLQSETLAKRGFLFFLNAQRRMEYLTQGGRKFCGVQNFLPIFSVKKFKSQEIPSHKRGEKPLFVMQI